MRIGFLMQRRNYYRLLGPVVDHALARGWDAECWDAEQEVFKGRRGLERREALPAFRNGHPRMRTYTDAGLARQLAETGPDVLVTLRPPMGGIPGGHVRWLALQYTLDIGGLVDRAGRTPFDAIGVHTEHWRERAADSLRILEFNRARSLNLDPDPVDGAAVAETLKARATVVGFPEMDQFHTIDPRPVRERLKVAPDVPVVVYCPFPFNSNPRTFWTHEVYGAGRLRQRMGLWRSGGRRYARHVANGWDDRGVARAARAFCDANGAALVVKARPKDPVPRYLARIADRVLYEQTDYPAIILEVMSIASLCLHFFSTVAYEAAYAGVPSICVTADGDDLGFPPIWRQWFLSTEPGSSFNFPGVIYPMSVEQVVADLPRRRLDAFPLSAEARTRYLEKFVGADDGKASDRLLDVASSLMDRAGGGP